jgi:hypothetical protein
MMAFDLLKSRSDIGLALAAVLFAMASANATPIAPMPAIDAIGGRVVLLSRDFERLESLPGYGRLLARKSANAADNPFGNSGVRLLLQTRSTGLLRSLALPEINGDPDERFAAASLKNVLLSIVNRRPGKPADRQKGKAAEEEDYPDEDDDSLFNLKKYLLENETVGGMLRAVIEPTAGEDGVTSFTVFGVGKWTIDADDGRALRVTELRSNISAQLSLDQPTADFRAHEARSRSSDAAPVNLRELIINWIIDFVTSPMGLFVLIAGAWILLFIAAAKFVIVLRPRRF